MHRRACPTPLRWGGGRRASVRPIEYSRADAQRDGDASTALLPDRSREVVEACLPVAVASASCSAPNCSAEKVSSRRYETGAPNVDTLEGTKDRLRRFSTRQRSIQA